MHFVYLVAYFIEIETIIKINIMKGNHTYIYIETPIYFNTIKFY